jgi:hypothetical protein
MRAIFQSLPHLLDELPNDEAREAIVFAVWPAVLGEHLRERSTPMEFANGILSVGVADREWKREMQAHAAEIVFKLNRTFGKSLVDRIELKVDPKALEKSRNLKMIGGNEPSVPRTPSMELRKASKAIENVDLRTHFLEAAAACIELRDSK